MDRLRDEWTTEEYEQVVRYFEGRMSETELQQFEERLSEDPGFGADVKLLSSIWESSANAGYEVPVDTDEALAGLSARIRENKRNNAAGILASGYLLKVAAVGLLLILAGLWGWQQYFGYRSIEADSIVMHELPDGSRVWLQEGAILRYRAGFRDAGRQVELSGTAYFDVEKDISSPFEIAAGLAVVKVLGTEFEVAASGKSTIVKVSEGRVELSDPVGEKSIILSAGEGARSDAATHGIERLAVEPLFNGFWATHELVLRDTPLGDLASALSSHFDIQIRFENQGLLNCTISSRFDDPGIEEVMEELSILFDLEIRIENGVYYLNGKGCER